MQSCVGVIHRYWICAYFTCACPEFGEQTLGIFWKTLNIIVWRKGISKKQPLKVPYHRAWYCDRHGESAFNSFSVISLTNDVRGVKQMYKVKVTTSDAAQPEEAGRRIDRHQQLLTFDHHFGHASHVSL